MAADLRRRIARLQARAHAAWAAGDSVRARRSWRRMLALAPGNVDASLGIAHCDLSRGRAQRALRALERCRRRRPRDAEILLAIGRARLCLGRPKRAERALRAALALRESADAHVALHECLARRGLAA
ncbi:MAG: hypothetical protein OEM49_06755, partial [Myxococcales bacterium]|nr:hypothetical protein [Myxococcales bacterium]